MAVRERRYWVVSPNVRNFNPSVGDWRQASTTQQAAFMGWDPDDPGHSDMGRKFAGKVPGGSKRVAEAPCLAANLLVGA